VQLAVSQGRRVIGITSGATRRAYVAGLGAAVVVDRTARGVVEAVRAAAPDGVDVVFEGVGRAAFDDARRMLRPRGHLVAYGQSSGPVPPVDPALLSGISPAGGPGSLTLTWPTLSDHNADPAVRRARAHAVFDLVSTGALTPHIDAVLDLADAAEAHRRLEAGEALGKLVLSVHR
jgi:NADPH2:quinone reductase